MEIILGLIVAALTWLLLFFIIEVMEYLFQEFNHEIHKTKQSWKRFWWDLEWALKHR
jgi:hypothetical protein